METKNLTPEQKLRLLAWCELLESGDLPQTRGALRVAAVDPEIEPEAEAESESAPVGFCCLGVACELYRRETGAAEWSAPCPGTGDRTFLGSDSYLPKDVREWLGLTYFDPQLTGVVVKDCPSASTFDSYGSLKTCAVKKGQTFCGPASWWNDQQEFTFAQIAAMIRKEYGLGEREQQA
jgi:hypothetical protein